MVTAGLSSAILLLTSSTLCQTSPSRPNPQSVSIVQLIASPHKYDGKAVTIIGCLKFEKESIILFLSCEDAKHYVIVNGLWVNPSKHMSQALEKLDGRYVMLVGMFSEYHTNTPHLSVGEIKDIKKAVPWQ